MFEKQAGKVFTLISVTLASFLTTFMASSINVAIPSIGTEFGTSAVLLNWIVAGYILASAATALPFGWLSDLLGRKKIFLSGVALFTVCTLLCGFAFGIQFLIVFRIFQGITSAMIFSTTMALIASAYPQEKRGAAVGIAISATYVGLSVGPVIGGFVNQFWGWRSIFYIVAALGLFAILFTVLKLRETHTVQEEQKSDVLGNIVYVLMISALLYGLSAFSSVSYARYFLIGGAALFVLFVLRELKVSNPLMPIRLFKRNLPFSLSNLAALVNYSASFAISYIMSLYLQLVLHFDSKTTGLILLCQPLFMAGFSPVAGKLSDRVEARVVASFGMGATCLGLLVFTFLGTTFPLWLLITNLAFIGSGLALFSSPNTNAIMSTVDKSLYGMASSLLATMRLIGQAVSMALATLVISVFLGGAAFDSVAPETLLMSMRVLFIVFTVLCCGGVFASLFRGNILNAKEKGH